MRFPNPSTADRSGEDADPQEAKLDHARTDALAITGSRGTIAANGDRMETHWSRILYCDILASAADMHAPSPRGQSPRRIDNANHLRNTRNKIARSMKSPHYMLLLDSSLFAGNDWQANSPKETLVARQDSDQPGSTIAMGAMLLGIFVAMYLAVGGIVQMFTPQESTASVPANRSGESALAAPTPASQSNADESTPPLDRRAYTD